MSNDLCLIFRLQALSIGMVSILNTYDCSRYFTELLPIDQWLLKLILTQWYEHSSDECGSDVLLIPTSALVNATQGQDLRELKADELLMQEQTSYGSSYTDGVCEHISAPPPPHTPRSSILFLTLAYDACRADPNGAFWLLLKHAKNGTLGALLKNTRYPSEARPSPLEVQWVVNIHAEWGDLRRPEGMDCLKPWKCLLELIKQNIEMRQQGIIFTVCCKKHLPSYAIIEPHAQRWPLGPTNTVNWLID